MSQNTTDPISDLINYLLSLDANLLRRLAPPKQNPPGFFGFVQSYVQSAPEPRFGTPLYVKLPTL